MVTGQTANDNEHMKERITDLSGDIRELIKKFDELAHIYVLREIFLPWQTSTERRLEILERDSKDSRVWETNEHTRLASQVVESERRIIERIDSNKKWTASHIVIIALAIIGWIISMIEAFHPFFSGK